MNKKNTATELSREQLLKELYEVLADKTLSFGCLCQYVGNSPSWNKIKFIGYRDESIIFQDSTCHSEHFEMYLQKEDFKIIGHEPTLSDVLLKLGERFDVDFGNTYQSWIITIYFADDREGVLYNPTKSFDNQATETLRNLYNLLCNQKEELPQR